MRLISSLVPLVAALNLACASEGGRPISAAAALNPIASKPHDTNCDSLPSEIKPSGKTRDHSFALGPNDYLFLGAGDIAMSAGAAQETGKIISDILESNPGRAIAFTTGDNTYQVGPSPYSWYDDTWGKFRKLTSPSPGNHDYLGGKAETYLRYFFPPEGQKTSDDPRRNEHRNPGETNYSFDLGGWHIVSLDSNEPSRFSDQKEWLVRDLKATSQNCILAFWHHPLVSSGARHGGDPSDPGRSTDIFWDVLEKFHADVVINGHDHIYERFAPQVFAGSSDPHLSCSEDGLSEFIVGTGGAEPYKLRKPPAAHSRARLRQKTGILALTLRPTSYSWVFLGTDGNIYDQAQQPQPCHLEAAHSNDGNGATR